MATNYDDAFRTLLNDCPQLILPVINETFHTNYDGTERIIFEPNEHFFNRQNGEEDKVITDTSFAVISNVLKPWEKGYIRKYHWECESGEYDPTLMIRLYEYDSQIALDYNRRIEGNQLIIEFPNSAVLILRSTSTTPDEMEFCIVAPNGESISYPVPTLKVQRYSLNEIFEKNLLFLLPFYLFTFDSKLEKIENDTDAVRAFLNEYEQIYVKLDDLRREGIITLGSRRIIMDMINHVVQLRCKTLENVREGVKTIMAGELLYSEAFEVLKQGRAEGEAKGRAEGEAKGRAEGEAKGKIEMLKHLVKEGLLPKETAAAMEAEVRRKAAALAESAVEYQAE